MVVKKKCIGIALACLFIPYAAGSHLESDANDDFADRTPLESSGRNSGGNTFEEGEMHCIIGHETAKPWAADEPLAVGVSIPHGYDVVYHYDTLGGLDQHFPYGSTWNEFTAPSDGTLWMYREGHEGLGVAVYVDALGIAGDSPDDLVPIGCSRGIYEDDGEQSWIVEARLQISVKEDMTYYIQNTGSDYERNKFTPDVPCKPRQQPRSCLPL